MKINEKQMIVSAALIRKGSKFLVSRRFDDTLIEPGKWEFPGGKVEFGEKLEVCLSRELKEEINIKVKIGKIIGAVSHTYNVKGNKYHVVLILFDCTYSSGKIKPIGCAETRWVSKKEIGRLDFATADIPLIRKITK